MLDPCGAVVVFCRRELDDEACKSRVVAPLDYPLGRQRHMEAELGFDTVEWLIPE